MSRTKRLLLKFWFVIFSIILGYVTPLPIFGQTVSQDEIVAYTHETLQSAPYNMEYIILNVIFKESRFKPDAVSVDGRCKGLTQINPSFHDIDDPFNYKENIDCCASYLEQKIEEYDSPPLALMCWNMGEDKALNYYNKYGSSKYAKDILKYSNEKEVMNE